VLAIDITTGTPATGGLENISPSAGGGLSGGSADTVGPTSADEAANYSAQNTSTGVVTHNQPQSSGNSKPIVPNLFLRTNNGLSGGVGGGNDDGTLDDAPSF
jgi:hypothetical protein